MVPSGADSPERFQEVLNYDLRDHLPGGRFVGMERLGLHPAGRAAYFHALRVPGAAQVFIKAFAFDAAAFAERERHALSLAHAAHLLPTEVVLVYGEPRIFVFPYCTPLESALPAHPSEIPVRLAFAMAAALRYASLCAEYARTSLIHVDLDAESFRITPGGRLVIVDHDNVLVGSDLPLHGRTYQAIPTKDEYLPPEAREGGKEWFFSGRSRIDDRYGLYQLGAVLRRWLAWDAAGSQLRRALDDPERVPSGARAALVELLEGLSAPQAERIRSEDVLRLATRTLAELRPVLRDRWQGELDRVEELLGSDDRAGPEVSSDPTSPR